MIRVIVVDDHSLVRRGLRETLAETGDIQVVGEAGDDSGVWAPAAQRVVALISMLSLATVRHVPRLPPRRLLGPMLISGTCGSLAIVAFALGVQQGDSLAAVAVSASMFPAVSATLAAAFDEDTLHWWQMIGILGVIAGISLMALG